MPDHFDLGTLGAYSWVVDLIAVDDDVREAALMRHEGLSWRWHPDRLTGTLVDPVDAFTRWRSPLTDADRRRLEPYAVVFLQWEARFPAQWREGRCFSPWSAKEGVLAAFARHGATPETRAALEDLLIDAVHRVQRCQDRWYWLLARGIDSPPLRSRLQQAAAHVDERVRLRARYVLWLIEHPEEAVTSRSWRRWRRTIGVAITEPRSAPELAALPAADAAAVLTGLAAVDLAAVFEAVEAGPAARIAAAIEDVAVVARAIEVMDARTARMLSAMPQPFAAELLTVMPPVVAAARFPSPKRGHQVLRLMCPAQALARLSLMPPTAAGSHLGWWPAADSAEFLMSMDPAAAADALAAMDGGRGPGRQLAAMPEDVALALVEQMPARDRARVRWMLETERFHEAARTSIAAADQ